jgi:hypothetical protein
VPGNARRGTVRFTVTRAKARLDRLSIVLRCTDRLEPVYTATIVSTPVESHVSIAYVPALVGVHRYHTEWPLAPLKVFSPGRARALGRSLMRGVRGTAQRVSRSAMAADARPGAETAATPGQPHACHASPGRKPASAPAP